MRVNAVNPGATLTHRLQGGLDAEARRQGVSAQQVLAAQQAAMPLRRLARPEEIANAVVFLSSDRASYITGAILAMDGAMTPMVV